MVGAAGGGLRGGGPPGGLGEGHIGAGWPFTSEALGAGGPWGGLCGGPAGGPFMVGILGLGGPAGGGRAPGDFPAAAHTGGRAWGPGGNWGCPGPGPPPFIAAAGGCCILGKDTLIQMLFITMAHFVI